MLLKINEPIEPFDDSYAGKDWILTGSFSDGRFLLAFGWM